MSIGNDATIGEQCLTDGRTIDLRGRQEAGVSIDRGGGIEEIVLRDELAEI
jgi:hypothetical protein